MRTRVGTALAASAIAMLVLTSAAPAGAQEGPPSLGFEVDRTEGSPGDEVHGQVDVADIAEHCTTDLAAFKARFADLVNGPFGGLNGQGELFDRFFPTGEIVFENHDQLAYSFTGLVAGAIAENFEGAAEQALPETFVMTFADIATQEPVGARGSFDPATGQGAVVVPDIDPGQWVVAAACVGPVLDLDLLEAGIRDNGAFLEQIGTPLDPLSPEFEQFVRDFLGDSEADIFDFLRAIGPDLVESIVAPDALGFQVFCIHDAEGRCPGEPPAAPPGGQPPPQQPPVPVAPPAQPVQAQPSFTG